jgi:hypothetical protein
MFSGILSYIGNKRDTWNHSILSVKLAVNNFNLNEVLAQFRNDYASAII